MAAPGARSTDKERISMRVRPEVKRTIQEAAALSGVNVTDFILDSAYAEAARRLERSQRIALDREQSREILAMLDRPGRFRPEIARAFEGEDAPDA